MGNVRIFILLVVLAVLTSGLIAKSEARSTAVIYTSSGCGYCAKMKNAMRRLGIQYRECNVEISQTCRTEFSRLGGKGVPLTVYNGKIIHGYNPEALIRSR